MALFKIFKGTSAAINGKKGLEGLNTKVPKAVEGYCYFTTDDGKMYIDTSDQITGRMALNAEKADKLNLVSPVGSIKKPIYFDENGIPQECNFSIPAMEGNKYALLSSESGAAYWSESVPYADQWSQAVNINGQNIQGQEGEVITPKWGKYASINTVNSDGESPSTAVYFNGNEMLNLENKPNDDSISGALTIKLPDTFRGNLVLTEPIPFKIGNTSKDFTGNNSLTWSHEEIGYATSDSSGLLSTTAQEIAGAKTMKDAFTVSSTLTANNLVISSDVSAAHLQFSRDGVNYIYLDKITSGSINICVSSECNLENSQLVVDNTKIYAGTTGIISLGTSDKRWSNLYSVGGNFSGAVTMSSGASIIGNLSVSNNTSTKTLTVTNTDNALQISLKRSTYNYISSPTDSGIAFCPNDSISLANSPLVIKSTGVIPGDTGVYNLGASNYKWNNIYGTKVYGAVWNDYAEFRKYKDGTEIPYGRVVIENGDDSLSLSNKRLQKGGNVCSDTFGFAIGETSENQMPIAVSGRALVYPYESRDSYKPGDALCTAPNGTVSKMTREEIKEYPDCIIGYVSAIPNYEIWGEKNTIVNGRIWIKVV